MYVQLLINDQLQRNPGLQWAMKLKTTPKGQKTEMEFLANTGLAQSVLIGF